MEFTEFAHLLKPVIGGGANTKRFTRTLFESMMIENGSLLIEDISDETFKAYFNGSTGISKIAERVLSNLDDENFVEYLDSFGESTAQVLSDTFEPYISDINLHIASRKIADLFIEILHEAAGSDKKKSTPKSAKTEEKTPHDILSEKILVSGKVLADVWGKAIENLANGLNSSESEKIELPEPQSADASPYSQEDKLLLQEFTSDYDEIMIKLISEGFAESLIDMTLPTQIKDLYESKWSTKADTFTDPSLKSHVFGLLGELKTLSDSLYTGATSTPFIRGARRKIRNLYVKLHPDLFADSFPYDAFIDDWDDEE